MTPPRPCTELPMHRATRDEKIHTATRGGSVRMVRCAKSKCMHMVGREESMRMMARGGGAHMDAYIPVLTMRLQRMLGSGDKRAIVFAHLPGALGRPVAVVLNFHFAKHVFRIELRFCPSDASFTAMSERSGSPTQPRFPLEGESKGKQQKTRACLQRNQSPPKCRKEGLKGSSENP